MLSNPLVLGALLCAAGSDVAEVSDVAIICLNNLSLKLKACEDDMGYENGPHVLLVKEAEFVAALVSLACDSGDLGVAAVLILSKLAWLETNQLPLLQFPGLLDALIATPHEGEAIATLSWLTAVKDEAQQVAMATNTALVDHLVANVVRYEDTTAVLSHLCSSDNNRALLYEHPGLIAAVTDATRVPACAQAAVGVLNQMTLSGTLMMPMLRNPLVLDAVLPAAGSDIDEVSDEAILCLSNLSLESENRPLMRDNVRIMVVLTARMDYGWSKMALFRICYIGDLPPPPRPTLALSLLCSRSVHHQLSLVKALIREHPEQVKDSRGRAALNRARAAYLPTPVVHFVRDCVQATAVAYSLTHLVGYKRSQIPLVRAQRLALMCCLKHLANEPAKPAKPDSRGVLNPGKALKAYRVGGNDPWSVIATFAY